MTQPLEIRLLGPLEVFVGGRPVHVSGPKRQALIVLLALRPGRVVTVDAAIDALWGTGLPAIPRNAVQHLVTRLRATLGPESIASTPDGYVLVGATVDAARFEEQLAAAHRANRRGDPHTAGAAVDAGLSLWRGRALQGLTEAPWVVGAARQLEARRADAMEERFEAALALGEHAEILGPVQAAIEEHPYRERLWAQLLLALYRSGRQVDALAAFQEARRVLSERLGIEPGPDLQRLQAAILAHDPTIMAVAVPRGRRGNLPASLSSFVDREEALDDVVRLLRDHRLVTVTGAPGVGKSRLGLEAARAFEPEVPDGAWLVDLTGAWQAADVAGVVAGAVGAHATSRDEDPVETVVRRFGAVRALLVLDGCGPVVDEAGRIAGAVLAGCPDMRLLATSREMLHLPGEVRVHLEPLAVPDPGSTDVSAVPSVQLFDERAHAARPGFELTEGTAGDVAQICRRLDGLPLAIELAAAHVNVLGLPEILQGVEQQVCLQAVRDRSALGGWRSFDSVMAWSYDLLDADERALLHLLATLGGAGLEAVAAAAARDGVDEGTVRRLLGALADKSLITTSFSEGEPRYDLLQTVREYVLERVASGPGAPGTPEAPRRLDGTTVERARG